MSKSRTTWLLAACLCIPLASCIVGDEGDPEDPGGTDETTGGAAGGAAEGGTDHATAPAGAPAVGEQSCEFSVQCEPCEAPWVQQTAQRTFDSCGASPPMWAIEYYCALCS